jgi:formylglycine-generating enzyme
MSQPCCGPSREGRRPDQGSPATAGPRNPPERFSVQPLRWASVPAGSFAMGTDDPRGYPEDGEGPVHQVHTSGFDMAVHAVTNDQFAAFVEATGHTTTAERWGSSFVFAGLLPDDFPPTRGVASAPWWRLVEGSSWRHPFGPHSDLAGLSDHPVVHVSWDDAVSFCAWSGTRLPTEAEWERAARGGLEQQHFPWGSHLEPDGRHRMNVFQGTFPAQNTGADGWIGTCPVGTYPANGMGLHETTGNVWEWCADWFASDTYGVSLGDGSGLDPRGPATGRARVMRGGSYLCHESYCWRYRVDSRSSNTPDSSAGNIGFRVARDPASGVC